nr:uncharacterized protein LOC123751835 [Procambarus clarkii]
MRVLVALVVVVVVVEECRGQVLDIPRFNDVEKKQYLNDLNSVVDCLVGTRTDCHPFTARVRNLLPELVQNDFKCNCPSQPDIDLFRRELSKPQNSAAYRKLSAALAEHV